MKKKVLLLTALSSTLVVGSLAAAITFGTKPNSDSAIASPGDYSITVTRENIKYDTWAGHYVETPSGNKISLSIANGEFWDDDTYGHLVPDGSFCFIRGNGGGIYFYDPLQSVVNVTTTFSFSDTVDNDLTLSFADDSGQFQNQANITSRSGDPVGSPVTEDRYLTYWYTGNSDTSHCYVQSIVINYTCV